MDINSKYDESSLQYPGEEADYHLMPWELPGPTLQLMELLAEIEIWQKLRGCSVKQSLMIGVSKKSDTEFMNEINKEQYKDVRGILSDAYYRFVGDDSGMSRLIINPSQFMGEVGEITFIDSCFLDKKQKSEIFIKFPKLNNQSLNRNVIEFTIWVKPTVDFKNSGIVKNKNNNSIKLCYYYYQGLGWKVLNEEDYLNAVDYSNQQTNEIGEGDERWIKPSFDFKSILRDLNGEFIIPEGRYSFTKICCNVITSEGIQYTVENTPNEPVIKDVLVPRAKYKGGDAQYTLISDENKNSCFESLLQLRLDEPSVQALLLSMHRPEYLNSFNKVIVLDEYSELCFYHKKGGLQEVNPNVSGVNFIIEFFFLKNINYDAIQFLRICPEDIRNRALVVYNKIAKSYWKMNIDTPFDSTVSSYEIERVCNGKLKKSNSRLNDLDCLLYFIQQIQNYMLLVYINAISYSSIEEVGVLSLKVGYDQFTLEFLNSKVNDYLKDRPDGEGEIKRFLTLGGNKISEKDLYALWLNRAQAKEMEGTLYYETFGDSGKTLIEIVLEDILVLYTNKMSSVKKFQILDTLDILDLGFFLKCLTDTQNPFHVRICVEFLKYYEGMYNDILIIER